MKTFPLHPHSLKYLQNGHPWVTKDRFSRKFPQAPELIGAKDLKGQTFALLINDPTHKKVAARLWSFDRQESKADFKSTLRQRLSKAFRLRDDKQLIQERQNFYLVFSEADQLPGLRILYLNGVLIVQVWMNFWLKWLDVIVQELLRLAFFPIESIYSQIRLGQDVQCQKLYGKTIATWSCHEFGLAYQLSMKEKDFGLFTDMSFLKKKAYQDFFNKKVLNLFCYTGAFSLLAIKAQAQKVTSVDLSTKNLNWLRQNIELNSFQDWSQHQIVASDVRNYLNSSEEMFDTIICDPPSTNWYGHRKSQSQENQATLPLLLKRLAPRGKLYLFSNQHSLTRRKFRQQIHQIISLTKYNSQIKIVEELAMGEDCPRLKGFPEGDYLKGLVIQKG